MPEIKLGNYLKSFRGTTLSQKKVAEHLGISIRSYQMKENSKWPFNQNEIELLKELFQKKYEELFYTIKD